MKAGTQENFSSLGFILFLVLLQISLMKHVLQNAQDRDREYVESTICGIPQD